MDEFSPFDIKNLALYTESEELMLLWEDFFRVFEKSTKRLSPIPWDPDFLWFRDTLWLAYHNRIRATDEELKKRIKAGKVWLDDPKNKQNWEKYWEGKILFEALSLEAEERGYMLDKILAPTTEEVFIEIFGDLVEEISNTDLIDTYIQQSKLIKENP